MGFTAVVARLPTILNRISRTARAGDRRRGPMLLVIIDSPGFHAPRRPARARQRARTSRSSTMSARRSGRGVPGAREAMRAYVDHLLALLALRAGDAPAPRRAADDLCRPSADRAAWRASTGTRASARRWARARSRLLVLPGSRRSEVSRLMEPFGAALRLLQKRLPRPIEVTIPAVAHLADEIARRAETWPIAPRRSFTARPPMGGLPAGRRRRSRLRAPSRSNLRCPAFRWSSAYRVSKPEEIAEIRHQGAVDRPRQLGARRECDSGIRPVGLHAREARRRRFCRSRRIRRSATVRSKRFERLDALMAIGEGTPSSRAADVIVETLARSRRI